MLVLSRKTGEEVRIGDDIVVKVTRVQGGRVRIGIEAPQHVAITRGDSDEPPQPAKTGAQYASALR